MRDFMKVLLDNIVYNSYVFVAYFLQIMLYEIPSVIGNVLSRDTTEFNQRWVCGLIF